jgi:hypothetical protein
MLMAELRASHQVNPQCQEKCIPMNSYDKAKQGGLEFMRSNNHEYFLDKNQTPLSSYTLLFTKDDNGLCHFEGN